jgi:hypothetical protein
VLVGRSANGRREWKTVEGHTLKELQPASVLELEAELLVLRPEDAGA